MFAEVVLKWVFRSLLTSSKHAFTTACLAGIWSSKVRDDAQGGG